MTAENERLLKELGIDAANMRQRLELDKRIAATSVEGTKAQQELANAQLSSKRAKEYHSDRLVRYESVFAALVAEERVLGGLYAPLSDRVISDPRLAKLAFVVNRVVDVEGWASRGEELLDLRRPPFIGRGELAKVARTRLLPAWQLGSPSDARSAMESFMDDFAEEALSALALETTPMDLGEWLFSTDHIRVVYGIQYEGVEIAHLSPGTRGVVLLTLYLALDEWDLRPLIIDQPEENLDPRSVYTELVPFFRDAAKRRQITMVTHNANLVVNTDSDQVIVAEARRTSPTLLPTIRYTAGALEDPESRRSIVHLLEGGEEAFRKRGERYGLAR